MALPSKYIQSSTISYHLHSRFHGLPNWLANSLLLFSIWQIEQSLKLWVRLCDSFAHSYPGSSYLVHNIKPKIIIFFLLRCGPCRIFVHWPGVGPVPLALGSWTTGLPGKSPKTSDSYNGLWSLYSPLILLSPCLLPHSHSLHFSHIGPLPIPASVPCVYCFLGLAVSFCRQPQGSLFHHIWNRCPPCISILFTLFNLSS